MAFIGCRIPPSTLSSAKAMPDVVIDNPVINSPYDEPKWHFVFGKDGITGAKANTRRLSSYFVPIPQPKHKGGPQLTLDDGWAKEREKTSEFINSVRRQVGAWRLGGYIGVSVTTRSLLDYWKNPDREKKLFFCQVEALETAIYLAEVATKHGDAWIENTLRRESAEANPGLDRVAFKMATGSGKTVVMAMLIAWQALNKLANPQDARFSDAFLIVTPGITIKDRLQVLRPNDRHNYYEERDLLPADQLQLLQRAKIVITNYHSFQRRDKLDVAALTKKVLAGPGGDSDAFKETPAAMVRRVCGDLGSKRGIVVINDEAHHCYHPKPPAPDEGKLSADEKAEVKANVEAARVWISGLEAVKAKLGVRTVYDLSATPFYLRGSGYSEGTLFPWVVSDFSLTDAIECGIVKVPRVPVSDNQVAGDSPAYRDLWRNIREELPRKGRTATAETTEPSLPKQLEGALLSLYSHYQATFDQWQASDYPTAPVFIVVCNNTNVSKRVYDWIAGWRKPINDASVLVPGKLALFSNVDQERWFDRPRTVLIDSAQLESGDVMDDAFKKIAAAEIGAFKDEYRRRTGQSAVDEECVDLIGRLAERDVDLGSRYDDAWAPVIRAVRDRATASRISRHKDPLETAINRPCTRALQSSFHLMGADFRRERLIRDEALAVLDEALALSGWDGAEHRAIIAPRLSFLLHVAPDWVERRASDLFGKSAPSGLGQQTVDLALKWGRPNRWLLERYRPLLLHAVRAESDRAMDHLMVAMLWAIPAFSVSEVVTLLVQMGAERLSKAGECLARLLHPDPDPGHLEIGIAFWEEALVIAKRPTLALRGFGWWADVEKLGQTKWEALTLTTCDRAKGNLALSHKVAERAATAPVTNIGLSILTSLVRGQHEYWDRSHIAEIALSALAATMDEPTLGPARDKLRTALNDYGYFER
jgi:hypothetical protein